MEALRAHTTIGPRLRFKAVRRPDPVALRWQRQYAASAAFWRTVGPTIKAAAAHGLDRADLLGALERALDGDRDTPLPDRVAAELADAIERERTGP